MSVDIQNISCLDPVHGISSLPNSSIDIAIIDPPFGIDYQSSWRTDKEKRHKKIVNDKAPYTEWIAPLFPKMKGGGRLFIFYRWDVMEAFVKAAREAGFKPVWDMVWDKMAHGMGDLKAAPAPKHEPFMYFTKGRYEFRGQRPVTVYRVPRVSAEKMIHPNEKPVALYSAILRDFATKGESMLDPFLGSGSSAIAAIQGGFEFRGYEIDTSYYQATKKRLNSGIQSTIL